MEHQTAHSPLTCREREIVGQILAGRSNKAMAATFGVKEQTIRNQLSTLFRKLKVSSRLELAVTFAPRDGRKP